VNPDLKADLHTHTSASDGAFDVQAVVDKLYARGIAIFSITDHDTVASVPAAMEAARAANMECIPGIEMSVWLEQTDIHVLGYFFDHASAQITEYSEMRGKERLKRAERIVEKLNALHMPITIDEVKRQTHGSVIGRPHIAAALVAGGHVATYAESFVKYIGNTAPAYEPLRRFQFTEALELMHSLGGVAVIAHPAVVSEEVLMKAIDAGVDGIETVHPSSSQSQTALFRSIASEYFLLETGGSDFHGGPRYDEFSLGKYWIPAAGVEKIRRFAQLQTKSPDGAQ